MTKEQIGSILKELRLQTGKTQKEVAELLGRKQQIVGHWETGYAQPDANTLFTLCEIYGTTVDAAFGFKKKDISISKDDLAFIEMYHNLDIHGREMVDFTLRKEWERSVSANDNIVTFSAAPKAARNNYINEPGEIEKTYEDISSLKRPE